MTKEKLGKMPQDVAAGVGLSIAAVRYALDVRPQGIIPYVGMIADLLADTPFDLSAKRDMLRGHTVAVYGAENFHVAKGGPAAVVTNHVNTGPLTGNWRLFALSHVMREETGKEIRWIMGSERVNGKRTLPVIQGMIEAAHERAARVGKCIFISEGSTLSGWKEALTELKTQQGVVGFHPETEPSYELKQGKAFIGNGLLSIARKDVPILVVGAYRSEKTLVLNVLPSLDNDALLALAGSHEYNGQGQAVVDEVMGVLARSLPENMRGYYRDYTVAKPQRPTALRAVSEALKAGRLPERQAR